ncbi:phospholipase D family protein [Halocynthiibacter sp. C4]|uniref:phospholipase D family protein n=1 Tax=Halocynthiibacter sp. C4 TaxID=2992758 RepID=UPI00237A8B08|nr:phospholipase D family protein [Halocynthiibacter sp. C4]MDE0588888.1 phospholipase D family protein [Halocynthiibacter sp. C4]
MRLLRVLLAIAAVIALFVVGMRIAFPLPDENFASTETRSEPQWDTNLGQAIKSAVEAHSDLNGLRPLTDGRDAFAARALLARTAQNSIDAQYYIWQHDTTGLMLLDELRTAAERGVRVRLLVDDNGVGGLDQKLAELDAIPSAQVRIFNPFTLRKPKLVSYLFDFKRLNRRMHNKSMTVDGVTTIVGGRNIGDIYFAFGEGAHYFDVDTIAIGPIVDDVSAAFDTYWNSGSAYDADLILASVWEPSIKADADKARATALGAGYREAIEEHEFVQDLIDRSIEFEWGKARLLVDDPVKGLGQATDDQLVVTQLFELLEAAKSSIDLVSAYFIPGERGTDTLTTAARSGVRTRVLTNSYDSTDVMPVHAGYIRYRDDLISSGVEVLELRAMREEHAERTLSQILAGSASGLHAKVFGIDETKAFIGSFNLDPRSAQLNTEMGILVDSPTIAKFLSNLLEAPTFAYQVAHTVDGDTVWVQYDENGPTRTFANEPNSTAFQRGLLWFVGLLPVEWML